MEFTVLSSPDESVDSYSALLRFDTNAAAYRASREVTRFNPGATVVTGNYLAVAFGNKLDRAACIRAIQLAGRYQAGLATPEESIFSIMRSYPGRDRVGELIRKEDTELHRRFQTFLSMYLPDAKYKFDLTYGLDETSRWIGFRLTFGGNPFRINFVNYNDGTERIHLQSLDPEGHIRQAVSIPSTDTIQDLASQLSRETR
jgi:hypothetical protein